MARTSALGEMLTEVTILLELDSASPVRQVHFVCLESLPLRIPRWYKLESQVGFESLQIWF